MRILQVLVGSPLALAAAAHLSSQPAPESGGGDPAASSAPLTRSLQPGPAAFAARPSQPAVALAEMTLDRRSTTRLYTERCAACHGWRGEGGVMGPPLLHRRYAPSALNDDGFRQAIRAGAPQRHWEFGPMPASVDLDAAEIDSIIALLRERQAERGLR